MPDSSKTQLHKFTNIANTEIITNITNADIQIMQYYQYYKYSNTNKFQEL